MRTYKMIKTENQKPENKNYELCADILATFSILEKWGFDSITSNLSLFAEVLNELDFKTFNGLPLNSSNLSNMFRRLSKKEQESLLEEFNSGFRSFHLMQEQNTRNIIH